MSVARTVLILTHRFDPTADKVVEELNNRGVPVFRLDTSEFPESLSVGAELANDHWSGQLRSTQRCLDLAAVSGIYYRRPTNFEFHPSLSDNERRWSAGEARMGFGGLLAALEPWLNHPHRIGYAEYKPAQLSAAVVSGLLVPRTLVTTIRTGHAPSWPMSAWPSARPSAAPVSTTTRVSARCSARSSARNNAMTKESPGPCICSRRGCRKTTTSG